jgi:hypothetical protein
MLKNNDHPGTAISRDYASIRNSILPLTTALRTIDPIKFVIPAIGENYA